MVSISSQVFGTIRPSDIPMTTSRTVSVAVKGHSTCVWRGIRERRMSEHANTRRPADLEAYPRPPAPETLRPHLHLSAHRCVPSSGAFVTVSLSKGVHLVNLACGTYLAANGCANSVRCQPAINSVAAAALTAGEK